MYARYLYAKFGIDENMSIDQAKHSLFGVSKASADLMVQEHGRYFDRRRLVSGGTPTGPGHWLLNCMAS